MGQKRLISGLFLCLFLGGCNPEDINFAEQNPNFCALVGDYLPVYISMSDTQKTRVAVTRLNILHACKCLPENKQPKVCTQ